MTPPDRNSTYGDDPLVSVVVPSLNIGRFLTKAIDSALAQSHQNLEVIVVDGGSTDDSVAVVRSYTDARVSLVESERGLSHQRIVGVNHARGDLIAFLDGDDIWYPTKLAKSIDVFRTVADVVAVGCRMYQVSETGKVLGTTGQRVGGTELERIRLALLLPFPISSVVIDGDAIREEFSDTRAWAGVPPHVDDLYLMSRLTDRGGVVCIEEPLGAYMVRSSSSTASALGEIALHTHYVQMRRAAEVAGQSLSWEQVANTHRYTFGKRRQDLARARYYLSGLSAAEGRPLGSLDYGIEALALAPIQTISRLAVNRPWRHLLSPSPPSD